MKKHDCVIFDISVIEYAMKLESNLSIIQKLTIKYRVFLFFFKEVSWKKRYI